MRKIGKFAAALAAFGMLVLMAGCAVMPPPRMSDNVQSTVTLTGLPSDLNGQYAILTGKISGAAGGFFGKGLLLRGGSGQMSTILTDASVKGVKIDNGTVTIPVFVSNELNSDGSGKLEWHGYADTKPADFDVFVDTTEMVKMGGLLLNGTYGNYSAVVTFSKIAFANGKASAKWTDGKVQKTTK
jgi:hypothetical protein